MLDAPDSITANEVFAVARERAPRQAIEHACRAVTGETGFLAIGRFVVHAPGGRLIDPAAPQRSITPAETMNEHALVPFDLALSRLPPRAPACQPQALQAVVLALRLGLLGQILDRAFFHLERRESFGKRLTHHQLVKTRFSETNALLSNLREEIALSLDTVSPVAVGRLHAEVDAHTTQSAKLMGGHGFLQGTLNGLEYLSSLLRASLVISPKAGG